MKKSLFVLAIVMIVGFTSSSFALTINWASTATNSNIGDAGDLLGKPDGETASFYNSTGATANYSAFPSGEKIDYNSVAFANLLNVDQSVLNAADVIVFEFNGSRNYGFETSDWIFEDGTNSMTVHREILAPPSGAIVAAGSISKNNYDDFFNASLNYNGGEWVYLLFDIDGNSNIDIFSSNFNITLDAPGTGLGTPDPDAIGLFSRPQTPVPEPATMLLFGLGLLGLAGINRKKS